MFDFKFDWNDELLLHIESVDTQHKEIFRIGREIEQLLTIRCIGVDTSNLLNIVCELREYVGYHFYEEERLMRKYGYSDMENHVKEHEAFRKKVMAIDCPKLAKNPYEELLKLKELIQDWIFEHMMHVDRKMSNEICEKMAM